MTHISPKFLYLIINVILLKFSYCLPSLKSITVIPKDQPDQADPVQLAIISTAACLFLGGQACSNNQIPIDPTHQLAGKAKLGSAQGLVLPVLKPLLGSDNFDRFRGTDVNLGQPRVNTGTGIDVLGIYKNQVGVRDAGVRGRGNYGAAWGDYSSVLGDLIGYGNVNDVNFNAERLRLDQERRNGVKGFYEETYRTVVDPFNLKVGQVKEICYARLLFGGKGICKELNVGLGPNAQP